MSRAIQIILGLALAHFSFAASAYHLDDHSRIATQAYNEFTNCFPVARARLNMDALVQADLDEDLNLIGKWLMYSHFYNPNKNLNMWRANSADRIQNLEPDLAQCRMSSAPLTEGETADLGHVVHHLQDMSVPAHVVPVNHAAWDGFESYAFDGDISSEWSCEDLVLPAGADLLEVLKLTAEETLDAVANMRVEAIGHDRHSTRDFSGRDFWLAADGDGFGEYGLLGNSFGSGAIRLNEGEYEIPDTAFREFKRQQMKRAVRATLRALAWAFPQSR